MKGRRGQSALLAGLSAVVLALAASLATAGRLGGWPPAVAAVGVLPFLLMAWGVEPAAGGRGRARTVVLAFGALWVTGCLAAVFVLPGREAGWTLLGLPAQLALLLLLLGVAPLLLLGVGYALTFEEDSPADGENSGFGPVRPVGMAPEPTSGCPDGRVSGG